MNLKTAHIILLVALALAARMGFTWLSGAYGQIINDDGERYARIALSLAAGDGYAWGPGEPTAHRPFGYPLLLAAIIGVFGPSMAAVQWIQALLGSLTVLPVYALGRALGGARAGVVAGLIAALHPVLIYLAPLAAPDAAALACEMGLVWCAWASAARPRDGTRAGASTALGAPPPDRPQTEEENRGDRNRGFSRFGRQRKGPAKASSPGQSGAIRKPGHLPNLPWLGFVACGAAGILLRPDLLLVVWLIPLSAFICARPRPAPRSADLWAAAATATLLAVAPVAARNAAVFGEFIPFPTTGGATFWCGNNALASGGCVNPSAETWPAADPPTMGTRGWPGLTETQNQARFYRAAFEWIRDNPADALRLIPRKLLRSWTLSFGDEARGRALPAAADWLHAAFGLAAAAGITRALARSNARSNVRTLERWNVDDRVLVAVLMAPVAAWLIKTVVFYGSARQTAVVLPIAAIFAAVLGRWNVRTLER